MAEDLARTLVQTLNTNFSFQHAIQGIPIFDGRNMPLKDYIQDLRNGLAWVEADQRALYLTAIIEKLRGPARNSICDNEFQTVEDLIKHLKERFATGKNFGYYNMRIQQLRMRQGQSVAEFYDYLKILLSSAEHALKEEKGQRYQPDMMVPLRELAVDMFIRGLPADISMAVDISKPATLQDAYKEAVRLEQRMNAHIIPESRYRNNRQYEQPSYQSSQPYVGVVRNQAPRQPQYYRNNTNQYQRGNGGPSRGQRPQYQNYGNNQRNYDYGTNNQWSRQQGSGYQHNQWNQGNRFQGQMSYQQNSYRNSAPQQNSPRVFEHQTGNYRSVNYSHDRRNQDPYYPDSTQRYQHPQGNWNRGQANSPAGQNDRFERHNRNTEPHLNSNAARPTNAAASQAPQQITIIQRPNHTQETSLETEQGTQELQRAEALH